MKNPAKTPKNIHSQDETARKRKLDGIPNRMAGYALKSKSNKRDGSPDTSKSDKEILKEVLEDKELKYLYTHGLKANACIKAIEKAIALTRKAERQRILEWAKKNRSEERRVGKECRSRWS